MIRRGIRRVKVKSKAYFWLIEKTRKLIWIKERESNKWSTSIL